MRVLLFLSLVVSIVVPPGAAWSSALPGESGDRARRGVGAAFIVAGSVTQASVLTLSIVGLATRQSWDFNLNRFIFQGASAGTIPMLAVGYGLLLGDGTPGGDSRGISIGLIHSGAYCLLAGGLGLTWAGQMSKKNEGVPGPIREGIVSVASVITGITCLGIGIPALVVSLSRERAPPPVALVPWGWTTGQGLLVTGRF